MLRWKSEERWGLPSSERKENEKDFENGGKVGFEVVEGKEKISHGRKEIE